MSTDLLSAGIFGISEASRLLNIPSGRLRNWVQNPRTESIICRDIPAIDHRIALSFVNLVEAHFINTFSQYGLHGKTIRVMADRAREFLQHPHPFATEFLFKTDGRRIFVETLDETGDPRLFDLRDRNWAMPAVLERAFKHDVVYGPSGLASVWYPRKAMAPNVVVNPKVAFGQPSLDKLGVPTIALFDAVCGANGDVASVSDWYEVPRHLVRQAVKFERDLITLH